MGAQSPNFDATPRNQNNAMSCEPVELETLFND